MREITVTVNLNGKNYKTNVIANKGMSDAAIMVIAKQQVFKQWSK